MNKKQLDKIKTILEEKKAKLENELTQFSTPSKLNKEDYNANFPDFGNKDDENSNEVAQFSDNLSLENALEKSLRDVNKALAAIDKNTYGICKYCHKPIDEQRLMARPTSSSCVACKTRLKAL